MKKVNNLFIYISISVLFVVFLFVYFGPKLGIEKFGLSPESENSESISENIMSGGVSNAVNPDFK